MARRIKVPNSTDVIEVKRDANGPYLDFNGHRQYLFTTALVNNTTAVGTVPEGSFGVTNHATGKGELFVAGTSVWRKATGNNLFQAILNQAGVAAPTTTTIVKNDLGGAVTLARTGAGVYTIVRTGAFPAGKVFVRSVEVIGGATAFSAKLERTDNDTLTLRSFNAAGAAADLVGDVHVVIEILP